MSDTIGKELTDIVDRYMHMFVRRVSEEYKMPAEELVCIWNNIAGWSMQSTVVKCCTYIFRKGKARGMRCTNRSTDRESEFCSVHKKTKIKKKKRSILKKALKRIFNFSVHQNFALGNYIP